MGKVLALFDFDGTVTEKDTMIEFVRYIKGKSSLRNSMIALAPWYLLHKLGLYSSTELKERFLSWHFKGVKEEDLEKMGEKFCQFQLPEILREKALSQIQRHRMQQHEVFIISASLEIWLKPWLEFQKIPYASTKGEYIDGKFTGRLATPNLKGEEKVKLIKERYNLNEYEKIYAYGDTPSDKPMLALAHISRYKPFRGKVSTQDKKL